MHAAYYYYYKKVKIPTYIYNGGEGEEAFSFLVFLCFCVYERQEYSQNRLNLVVSILTCLLLFIYFIHVRTRIQKRTKRRNSCLSISLYKLAQQMLQEQLAIGLESSLPYWPITGPSPRMPPT